MALGGIEEYNAFDKSLRLPSSLSEIGIGDKDFSRIAQKDAKIT